jgi:long-subunit acyl-CoA synthetase (AMP-forming)
MTDLLRFLKQRLPTTAPMVGVAEGPILCLSELDRRTSALATELSERAINCLALDADNGPAWLVADLACQRARIPLLPLPGFFSDSQKCHAMTATGADALISDRTCTASRWGRTIFPVDDNAMVLTYLPTGQRANDRLPPGTGKITFTSGSTGTPKGVCLSNGQLLHQAATLALAAGQDSPRHLCLLPLPMLLENVAGAYTAMVAGGQAIVPALDRLGFNGSTLVDPGALLRAIDTAAPQTMILVPRLLEVLVSACEQGWSPPESLRFVAVGGSRVPPAQIHRARTHGIPVYEGYGLSECASVVSLNTPANDRPGTAGKPLPHLTVTFDRGELTVAGNPFLGYVGEPRSWGQETVATGDLGEMEDGFLVLRGRRKNLLVSSYGRNISPEWVESEILAGPAIADCIVFGDARPWPVALVQAAPGATDHDINRWLAHCNRTLPDYARVHRWQHLPSPLADVPGALTANGRPRREAITRYYRRILDDLYAEGTTLPAHACKETLD